jgi:hypothetical protein
VRTTLTIIAAALSVALAAAPAVVEAKAGSSSSKSSSSSSVGSRGSKPMDAQPRAAQPQAAPGQTVNRAPATAPAQQGSFFQRNPIMTGIAAGLAGSWIGSMLFGNSAQAAPADGETSGFGHAIGSMLPWLLIGGLGFGAWMMFRRRQEATAGGYPAGGYAPQGTSFGGPAEASPSGGLGVRPITIPASEYPAFETVLYAIQEGWSRGDVQQMARHTTDEMLEYFQHELESNTQRGIANRVEDVKLTKGDVVEAWEENGLQYATARLSWTARDYSIKLGAKQGDRDYLIGGSPTEPVESTEIWTFVRGQGEPWILSAIQQEN